MAGKYSGFARFFFKGDEEAAKALIALGRKQMGMTLDLMGKMGLKQRVERKRYKNAVIETIAIPPHTYNITIFASSVAQELEKACDKHGFLVDLSSTNSDDQPYLLLPVSYNELEYVDLTKISAGNHAWWNDSATEELVSWDTSEDSRHYGYGAGSSSFIYIYGCLWAKAPASVSGAAIVHDQIVVSCRASPVTIYWRPFQKTPYDETDDALYDADTNPNGWKSLDITNAPGGGNLSWGVHGFSSAGNALTFDEKVAALSWNETTEEFTAAAFYNYEIVNSGSVDHDFDDTTDDAGGRDDPLAIVGGESDPELENSVQQELKYVVATSNPDFDSGLPCSPTNKQWINPTVKTYYGDPTSLQLARSKEADQEYMGGAYTYHGTRRYRTFKYSLYINEWYSTWEVAFANTIHDLQNRTYVSQYERTDFIDYDLDTESKVIVRGGENPWYDSNYTQTGYQYGRGGVNGAFNGNTYVPGSPATVAQARVDTINSTGCGLPDNVSNVTISDGDFQEGYRWREGGIEITFNTLFKINLEVVCGLTSAPIFWQEKNTGTIGSKPGNPRSDSSDLEIVLDSIYLLPAVNNYVSSIAEWATTNNDGTYTQTQYSNTVIQKKSAMVLDLSARDSLLLMLEQTEGESFRIYWKYESTEEVIKEGPLDSNRPSGGLLFDDWNYSSDGVPRKYAGASGGLYYFHDGNNRCYNSNFQLFKSRIVSRKNEILVYVKLTVYDEEIEMAWSAKGTNAGEQLTVKTLEPSQITFNKLKAL